MLESNLNGQHVLLLMPKFFNYHELLVRELESQGAIVDFIENKLLPLDPASPTAKFRFLRRILYYLVNVRWLYLKKRINLSKKYDVLFCINGFSFDRRLISSLKRVNPSIKTILYLWDSSSMFQWNDITTYFDRSFSFDPLDAKSMNISYLPNFYPKNALSQVYTDTYDLFFVGTQHADRYSVLNSVVRTLGQKSSYFVKLLIKYKNVIHNYYLYKLMRTVNTGFATNYVLNYELVEKIIQNDFLIHCPLDEDTIISMMAQSRCILDIQSPYQVGLPHQLVLAIAMGKKIITANTWIKNYEFYNPSQILIIDRQNPVIPEEFLKTNLPDGFLKPSLMNTRIDEWVMKLFQQ